MSLLLRRHGYEGAGIKQVAREASASLGSVYHFFPGGKAELAAEAIGLDEREFGEMLRAALAGQRDPGRALVACTRAVAASLVAADWIGACTFTGTTIATSEEAPQVRAAISAAVEHWQAIVAEHLRAGGLSAAAARDLACTTVALLEGATVACQIARDDRPLRIAGRHLARLAATYRQ